jgi:crotonobetainyl-CoA:carnitine CoA-transferase CaiB-like acyl-CoA transferase
LVLHDTPAPEYVPSARLGEHNAEVLSEYLGLSGSEIDGLRRSGAIAQS